MGQFYDPIKYAEQKQVEWKTMSDHWEQFVKNALMGVNPQSPPMPYPFPAPQVHPDDYWLVADPYDYPPLKSFKAGWGGYPHKFKGPPTKPSPPCSQQMFVEWREDYMMWLVKKGVPAITVEVEPVEIPMYGSSYMTYKSGAMTIKLDDAYASQLDGLGFKIAMDFGIAMQSPKAQYKITGADVEYGLPVSKIAKQYPDHILAGAKMAGMSVEDWLNKPVEAEPPKPAQLIFGEDAS